MKDGKKSSAKGQPKKPAERSGETARLCGDLRTIATRLNHDLHTPLGGIIFSTEALKQRLPENDPAARALVASIRGTVDELSQIIKRTCFVLKASVSEERPEKLSMGEPVAKALDRLEGAILKKGASVGVPSAWPEVSGVSAWLEVVWWNLLTNALQHAGDTPRIELGWTTADGKLRFEVLDNGGGVAGNQRDKLFHKFEALYESNSSRGLGLSIVERLIDLQGGQCGYEPNPKGGSCFFFDLPVG